MKTNFRKVFLLIVPVLFTVYLVGCNFLKTTKVVLDVSAKPFEKLSEYHFFTGTMSEQKPNMGVVPYELITTLFTDYAFKARFLYMPEGKIVPYDTTQVLQFPVGACLIKNFYYPHDFRKPEENKKIIETRLLVHRETGWEALDYIWNDAQDDAKLDIAGDIKKVSWTHYDGTIKEIDYLIPNKNQCKGCHWYNGTGIVPIGPKVRNLNRDCDYETGSENQLTHWAKAGLLKNAPSSDSAPVLADWKDSLHYSVEERSRAYMEVNCAHCHNPKGPAYTSGLYLNLENGNMENLGFCKSPVAAGKATGNLFSDIVPGKPDSSIMIYRMISDDPGIRMPEIGRSVLHKEGVDLITRWISELKPDACKAR